jgi:hypothetical protein
MVGEVIALGCLLVHGDVTASRTVRLKKKLSQLRDAVGLFVDPPARSLVLSIDEKSQIQAPCSSQGASCRPQPHRGRSPRALHPQ